MKVTVATFRNFSSYIVKDHSSWSPLLILTSPCIIIKTWSLIFRGTNRYLSIHHSHNRDDDGNGGKKNVKGADDDCSSSKTCAAKTFLPPVVRFHHRLLHFQIVFRQCSNNWEFISHKRETAGKRGWKRLPFFGVCERVLELVLPGKVKVRRSHPQDIFAPSLNCVYKHLLLFHFIENEISIFLRDMLCYRWIKVNQEEQQSRRFVRFKLDNFKINILDY